MLMKKFTGPAAAGVEIMTMTHASVEQMAAPVAMTAAVPNATAAAASGPANNTAANHDERVLGGLRSMKTLFESRLAGLAWRGMTQRRPLAAVLWRELTEAGCSPALARTIVARLPDDFAEAQARQWLRPQAGAAFAFQEDEMPMRSLPGLAAAPAGAGQ